MVSFSGIPSSAVIVAVSSSERSPSPAAIAANASARSARGVAAQPSKAPRAASTALSTSTGVQPGIVAIVSSVAELTTGSGSAPAGTHPLAADEDLLPRPDSRRRSHFRPSLIAVTRTLPLRGI